VPHGAAIMAISWEFYIFSKLRINKHHFHFHWRTKGLILAAIVHRSLIKCQKLHPWKSGNHVAASLIAVLSRLIHICDDLRKGKWRFSNGSNQPITQGADELGANCIG
jgi:hypothetical protein